MQARFPQGFGTDAQVGDVLFLGHFKRPGSPARDKEPFWAFRNIRDPFSVSHVRRGDVLLVWSPPWSHYDGRLAWLETYDYDVRSIRANFEPELCFYHSVDRVGLSALPKGLDFKFRLVFKSTHFAPPA